MRRTALAVFLLCLSVSFAEAASPPDRTVLVPGNPALQQNAVDDIAGFLEWIFQTRLAEHDKRAFQDVLVDAWKRGDRSEMSFWVGLLRARLQAGDISSPRAPDVHEKMGRAVVEDLQKYSKRAGEVRSLFAGARQPSQSVNAPAAGSYAGSYTTSAGGSTVTLNLEQGASGQVRGELSSTTGVRFSLEGSVTDKGNVMGTARGPQGAGVFLAELAGNTLTLTVADLMPNGQPNMASARRVLLQRGGSGAPAGGSRDQPVGGQSPAEAQSPMDQQIAQLLLSSAWCSLSFSGVAGTASGSSRSERATFRADGNGQLNSGGESYYSNPYGFAAGHSSGGQMFRWQVRGGMLMLSFDGGPWSPTPLQITRNSNGYPIINAGGKEYSMCN